MLGRGAYYAERIYLHLPINRSHKNTWAYRCGTHRGFGQTGRVLNQGALQYLATSFTQVGLRWRKIDAST